MQQVNETDPRVPLARQGDTHVDRLNALWKLSVKSGLSDAETARILADMGVEYGRGWHFGRPQLV